MRLYQCIAQVDLEVTPRRMFFCTYVMNEMHNVDFAWCLYNMMLTSFDEHDIRLNYYVCDDYTWYDVI